MQRDLRRSPERFCATHRSYSLFTAYKRMMVITMLHEHMSFRERHWLPLRHLLTSHGLGKIFHKHIFANIRSSATHFKACFHRDNMQATHSTSLLCSEHMTCDMVMEPAKSLRTGVTLSSYYVADGTAPCTDHSVESGGLLIDGEDVRDVSLHDMLGAARRIKLWKLAWSERGEEGLDFLWEGLCRRWLDQGNQSSSWNLISRLGIGFRNLITMNRKRMKQLVTQVVRVGDPKYLQLIFLYQPG